MMRRPRRAAAAAGHEPGQRDSGTSQWRLLTRLGPYVRPYRGWLLVAVLATAVGGLLGLGFPWVLGTLVDSALDDGSDGGALNRATAILVAIFAAQALMAALRIYALAHAGQHIVNGLRSALFNTLIRLPMRFLDRRSSGALSTRLVSDAAFAYGAASGAGPQMVNSVITVIGGAVLMVVIQPTLALLVLALLPVAGLVGRHYGRRMRTLSQGYQNGLAATNALAGDALSSARVVKLYSAERNVARLYHTRLQTVIEQGMARARARALWTPATMFLTACGVVAVVWVGGRQVQSGALTAGALVSFLLYARFVADGTSTLVTQYSRLAQAMGATERVITLLDEPREPGGIPGTPPPAEPADPAPAPSPGQVIEDRRGSVHLEHVSFAYPTRRTRVLHDITLTIGAGETVTVVGHSGAGKSTLVHLISRLYDPDQGVVEVDGVDVRDQDLSDLRRSMAIVPQDTLLLSASIADNIRLGRRSATREEVADAARAANAHDFITGFPRGYATAVGERGTALSGGQRQRIAIARALLADPRILILDEATNALDPRTEESVTEAVAGLMRGRTNIVIAHRISTALHSPRVIVLRNGRIVEDGDPGVLLRQGGEFAALCARQAEDEAGSAVTD